MYDFFMKEKQIKNRNFINLFNIGSILENALYITIYKCSYFVLCQSADLKLTCRTQCSPGLGARPCTSIVHRWSSYTVQRSTFLWSLNAVHCTAKYIPMTEERSTRSAKYIPMTVERCTWIPCTLMVHRRTQNTVLRSTFLWPQSVVHVLRSTFL